MIQSDFDDSNFLTQSKQVLEALEDYPLHIKAIGLGYAHASRGVRLYRKLDSLEKEFKRSEHSKFSEYIRLLKAPAAGFISGFFNRMDDNNKQVAAKLTGEIITDMFSAANREAEVKRQMMKNKVPIHQIRKIGDGEVKIIRSSLTSEMQRAFDRHLELPESQLLELALHIMERGEQ
jgi:hypothetical protein